jgi:chitinase
MWGQVANHNHGLYQQGKPVPNGYSNYGTITTTMLNHGFDRYWDATASAPYLYNADKQIFVSYDDPESIAVKCKYVLTRKLGGVMFWDYSGDPSGALLHAIQSSLHPQASGSASTK